MLRESMKELDWNCPSTPPPLDENMVHLIRFGLQLENPADVDNMLCLLDGEERARAARFKRPIHQHRFAVGRARLRILLGHYTQQSPEAVVFAYGEQGKPRLAASPEGNSIHFNLSHSGDSGVCAVTRNRSVGVDIECCRQRIAAPAIAERFFHPEEAQWLAAQHGEAGLRQFYRLWTAKEALLKGAGGGLTLPLNRCRFDLTSDPLGLRLIDLPALETAQWTVYSFALDNNIAGAVAVTRGGAELHFLEPWAQLPNWGGQGPGRSGGV